MLSAANIFRHSKHTGLSSFPTVVTVKPNATYASSYFLVLAFGRLSFVSLSPSLSAFLFIPVKYFFMVSLEGLFTALYISCSVLCVRMLAAKKLYTIALILPAHTLTMRAPLPPTVVDKQFISILFFILVREKSMFLGVTRAPPGAPHYLRRTGLDPGIVPAERWPPPALVCETPQWWSAERAVPEATHTCSGHNSHQAGIGIVSTGWLTENNRAQKWASLTL